MKTWILALAAIAALLFAVPAHAGGLGVGGCGLGACGGFNQSLSVNHNFGVNNSLLGNRFGFGGFNQSLTIRHRSGVGLGAGLFNRGGVRHRTTIRHRIR